MGNETGWHSGEVLSTVALQEARLGFGARLGLFCVKFACSSRQHGYYSFPTKICKWWMWMVACLHVLALQWTGNLSRVYLGCISP